MLNGLNPGQMVIKIVKEEMEALMGSTMTEIALRPGNEITIIMMAGLQGAGKTTTCAKLAGQYKKKENVLSWLPVTCIVRRRSSSFR